MRPNPLMSLSGRMTALLVGAVVMAGGLLVSSPAAAHDRLLSSDPAAGAVLATPPDRVTLTYSNEVARELVTAAVTVPGGSPVPVPAEDVGVTGAEVVLDVSDAAARAPAGEWSVVVRIVSADGHPVESVLDFEARAAAPDVSSASPAPRLDETPAAAGAADAAVPPPAAAEDDGQGVLGWSPLALAAGVLAVVVLLAGGLVAVARRR